MLNLKNVATFLLSTVLGAAVVLAYPGTALAGPGTGAENTDGGFEASASDVTVTGDVSGSLRASVPGPPPLCWWAPKDVPGGIDPGNVEAVGEYLENLHLTGHAGAGNLAYPGGTTTEAGKLAVKAEKSGKDVTWYELGINKSALPSDYESRNKALVDAGCTSSTQYTNFTVLLTNNFFPAGNPPAPSFDPEVLAEYAYEVMDLVDPDLDWNPKINRSGDATLVNLPTWLWTDNSAAVEERSVTATAGSVSVTVTANTGGMSVSSPAGTTECGVKAAQTAWSKGVSESSACVLRFDRASTGYANGFPVQARTEWEASWTANSGEGGALDPASVGATTYVPVTEAQSIVTGIG